MSNTKAPKTTEAVEAIVEDNPVFEAETGTPPEAVASPVQPATTPSAQETINSILMELARRDKLIQERDERIAELMRERVELAARLDHALKLIGDANSLAVSANRDSYNSMLNEYNTIKSRIDARKKQEAGANDARN